MKNEEASQVSRLEEEVRALKQKLLAQQQQQSQLQTASTSSLSSPANAAGGAGAGGDGGNSYHGDGGGDRLVLVVRKRRTLLDGGILEIVDGQRLS